MDSTVTTLAAVMSIFAVMALGSAIRRLNWLTEEADHSLLRVLIRVLMPCLIFSVIVGNERLKEPVNVLVPPLVGYVSILVGFALAYAAARLLGKVSGLRDARERRTFVFVTGIYNWGYIPIPLIRVLYDDTTLGTLFVLAVGIDLAFWTVGVVALTGGLTPGWWKRAASPPAVAIVIALFVNAIGVQERLPVTESFFNAIELVGQAAIPMGLLLVGAMLADEYSAAVLRARTRVIALGSLLRLGLLPILFLVFAKYAPVSVELKRVLVVESAMPTGVFAIIMARHYDGDPPTALCVIVGTSLIALITIPLWLQFGMWYVDVAPLPVPQPGS